MPPFTAGFSTNLDDYIRKITVQSDFTPFGELQHVYTVNNVDYEVYKVRL